MPTVKCRFPVTHNGKRYKPGDVFYAEDKYIDEVSKCCECVEQRECPKLEQNLGKSKTKKASK
ncbi:MAG: hypothetical protein IJ268_13165 [Proteobacteria bacterium]|nr:hypothetical protein [Pseudomonadota bacterium]